MVLNKPGKPMAKTVLKYSPLAPAISPASPEEAQLLRPVGDHKAYNIIHLIYRVRNYEGHSKDYDFSRASMQEQWRAGYYDTIRTLRHPEVLERPANHEGVFTFDLSQMAANRTGFVDVPLACAAAQPCDRRTNGQLT
jgi:Patatin phospholipase